MQIVVKDTVIPEWKIKEIIYSNSAQLKFLLISIESKADILKNLVNQFLAIFSFVYPSKHDHNFTKHCIKYRNFT